jgi:hypothetical protein
MRVLGRASDADVCVLDVCVLASVDDDDALAYIRPPEGLD